MSVEGGKKKKNFKLRPVWFGSSAVPSLHFVHIPVGPERKVGKIKRDKNSLPKKNVKC
jgi:hypothetical protein